MVRSDRARTGIQTSALAGAGDDWNLRVEIGKSLCSNEFIRCFTPPTNEFVTTKVMFLTNYSSLQQPQCILTINAAQHIIRQIEAVNLPASLPRGVRGIIEIFVRGFKKTKMQPIHLKLRHQVGAEENAVS